ncbi:DUF2189 domain-containing protein [Sinorhizobium chiapasense]|uniref:DUF2189 domain-containing protein n=1 Tax=Sinorhizobium chiapasense TaxID=501572 RepID=A0ABZ2B7D6_9HYPH
MGPNDIVEPYASPRARHLPPATVFQWLRKGWQTLIVDPVPSLIYGVGVFLVSVVVIWTLFTFGYDYILFPALAGFMVVAPFLAIGLYEKARLTDAGEKATLVKMLFVRPASGAQVLFIGVLLMLLMATWMRAAVIVYALFFGVRPFPGLDDIAPMLFGTPTGWAMLLTGCVIGGLFAAFSFAIAVISIPMLLDQRLDAFTAMGTSIATAWNNLPVMIAWGFVVLCAFLLSVLTVGVAMIVLFPVIGHATWYVYQDMK